MLVVKGVLIIITGLVVGVQFAAGYAIFTKVLASGHFRRYIQPLTHSSRRGS